LNLRISGSISTNKEKKADYGMWDLTGIKEARRKCTRFLNKDPP